MNPIISETGSREHVIDAAIAEFLIAKQEGRPVDRAAWLAKYPPELAKELSDFLTDEEQLGGILAPFKRAAEETVTLSPFRVTLDAMSGITSSLPFPKTVGDYELLEEIAHGGMGVVFKARQKSLNRFVAVKMLIGSRLASPKDIERFQREAEAAAGLDHPNIVPIYEVGTIDGLPFFSMKLIENGSLEKQKARFLAAPRLTAELMAKVARAVHHAHQRGILHRDLKPSNILIDEKGDPHVADYGLAKRIANEANPHGDNTVSGSIVGSPSYMAPEQARGQIKQLTTAVDVYGLGAILYDLLACRPPFHGETPAETLLMVISRQPETLSRVRAGVPRDLETICMKCLAKDPSKRYASAEALAEDLTRYQEDRSIIARPAGRLERAWRWCRHNPVVAALSATAAGIVLTAIFLLYQERTRTLANLDRAVNAERDLLTSDRDRTEQLGNSYRDTAEARRFSRQVGQRFESIKALKEAARIARSLGKGDEVLEDLRRKAIASLALTDLRLEQELPGSIAEYAPFVAINDTFERYAVLDKIGSICVRRVADGLVIADLSASEAATAIRDMSFSPDGRYLVAGYKMGNQMKIWDIDKKNVIFTSESAAKPIRAIFSTDSRCAILNLDGEFIILELSSGQVKHTRKSSPPGSIAFAFRPDGSQFASLHEASGVVQLWSKDSGNLLNTMALNPGTYHIAWSRDGDTLASVDGDPRIHLWDLKMRGEVGLLEGHKNNGVVPFFHPKSNLLASNGWESTLRVWDPGTGRQLLSMPSVWSGTFNSDGDRLLLHGKTPQVYEFADGREYRTFVHDPLPQKHYPYGCSVSPDGRLLAVGQDDGTRIWELASGKQLFYLPTGHTYGLLFEPSGDLLTCGSKGRGLERWPIRADADQKGVLRIGPPDELLPGRVIRVVQSKDGRTLAAFLHHIGVKILNRSGWKSALISETGNNALSMSPDGTLVAIGTGRTKTTQIWATSDNHLEAELSTEGQGGVVFSGDGRWLATDGPNGGWLWKVGSWERGIQLPPGHGVDFTPDGGLVVVTDKWVTTFIDPETGRTVFTLEDPNQDRPYSLAFTPDGSQFAATTHDSYSAHVWDLRRLRAELKLIDLDWVAPEYASAPPSHAPLRIESQMDPSRPQAPPQVHLHVANPRTRAATPEQIKIWIKQLEDKEAKNRSEAARFLEEVGRDALKALDVLSSHRDADIRQQAMLIRDRIATAEALSPQRINLKFVGTPIAEAIRMLADATGHRLVYLPGRYPKNPLAKTVTLELEGLSFFESLDRICQAAGLVQTANGTDSWNLTDGKATGGELLSYSGRIRMRMHSIQYSRWVAFPDSERLRENLSLKISLENEGGKRFVSYGTPRLVEANDNNGQSLIPGPTNVAAVNVNSFRPFTSYNYFQSISLSLPAEHGGALKQLKISLPVEIMVRQQELITVPDFAKSVGKVFATGNGLCLKVISVSRLQSGQIRADFSASKIDGPMFDPNSLRVKLTDAKGVEHAIGNVSYLKSNTGKPDLEDLIWIVSTIQSGSQTQLPWTALSQHYMKASRRSWLGSVSFNTQDSMNSPINLTLFHFDPVRTELEFEFRNIPLP